VALVVVSGTGTEVGKTHFSVALLTALATEGRRVAGIKPIETGLAGPGPSDAQRLADASTFHVKHRGYGFGEAISPHLAARHEAMGIDVRDIADSVKQLRGQVDVLLVELAGGLFTPLSETTVNAHLARALAPEILVLVAPDRVGVLHDVIATVRAATTVPLAVDGVLLMAAERADASAGQNAGELQRILASQSLPILGSLPRAPTRLLAGHPDVRALAHRLREPFLESEP
jgi:dethiobiotin synthetase